MLHNDLISQGMPTQPNMSLVVKGGVEQLDVLPSLYYAVRVCSLDVMRCLLYLQGAHGSQRNSSPFPFLSTFQPHCPEVHGWKTTEKWAGRKEKKGG